MRTIMRGLVLLSCLLILSVLGCHPENPAVPRRPEYSRGAPPSHGSKIAPKQFPQPGGGASATQPPAMPVTWTRVARYTSLDAMNNASGLFTFRTSSPRAVLTWARFERIVPVGPLGGPEAFEIVVMGPGGNLSLGNMQVGDAMSGAVELGDPGEFSVRKLSNERLAIEVYEPSASDGQPQDPAPVPGDLSDVERRQYDDEIRLRALEERSSNEDAALENAAVQAQRRNDMEKAMRNASLGGSTYR